MLRFLTSLTFLYGFSIVLLIIYGIVYYINFTKGRYQRNYFPWIFLVIGIAGFSFLYINLNAPLSLRTYTNTNHHFIRHDGFRVVNSIEFGRSDTTTSTTNKYNSFLFKALPGSVQVTSGYSEDPFYTSSGGKYELRSPNFPAAGHRISYKVDTLSVSIHCLDDESFELHFDNHKITTASKLIRRGISLFNLFKDQPNLINNKWFTNENLVKSLNQIYLVRNEVSREDFSQLSFFISGKSFSFVSDIQHDSTPLNVSSLAFTTAIKSNEYFAWGLGFLDNNRNQFRIEQDMNPGFRILNRYPVSYPLSESGSDQNFSAHGILKFLVADGTGLVHLPAVFEEGFLFPSFPGDTTLSFEPVLLNYEQKKGNTAIKLSSRFLPNPQMIIHSAGDTLILPSVSQGFDWLFSINNSFNWQFSKTILPINTVQILLFGSLGIFFLTIFFTALILPVSKVSWVWQLFSVITFILLVTRFFLYWRYKSFPPYESLDLPSLQQLNSIWNFAVIIFAALLFTLVFGWGLFKQLFLRLSQGRLLRKSKWDLNNRMNAQSSRVFEKFLDLPVIKKAGSKVLFFSGWFLCLGISFTYAALSGFDSTASRHIAIFLILAYFFFLWLSYRFSPLVSSSENSWWVVSTSKYSDLIISNPVKVLLSVTLLAVFSVVDIGFAIIFLNFLLFNEAFLCINYGIARLSAGSKRNAFVFAVTAFIYLLLFILNLLYGPFLYRTLLELPQFMYSVMYMIVGFLFAYCIVRITRVKRKAMLGLVIWLGIFLIAFLFFPKARILEKARMTKYRIDVMTMPVADAIENAYAEGKTYEPVIRAAQNQWFINTFIYEENNPGVNRAEFNLLPHAPQSKGVKYNAQATDLVASRFLLAEHGRWAVLLYVLILLLPASLLAFFYKLYPDFTNRINSRYPFITTGFSIINYFVISALLVILAATGRYIFFGQDLPFGSILSKQSILFPAILIIITVLLFKNIPLEQYPNRKKLIPGTLVFTGLGFLLFFLPPVFNKEKEFGVNDVATSIDAVIQQKLQPVINFIDSSQSSSRLSFKEKDALFADSLRSLIRSGHFRDDGNFFQKELSAYSNASFSQHVDQRKLLFLDLHSGRPQLAVNDNFFRVQAPPHLQEYWTGNVFGDSSLVTMTLWDNKNGDILKHQYDLSSPSISYTSYVGIKFGVLPPGGNRPGHQPGLINSSGKPWHSIIDGIKSRIEIGDTIFLRNPQKILLSDPSTGTELVAMTEPATFMRNLLVNGSRYYVYPRGNGFTWARNFSESISAGRSGKEHVYISANGNLLDSISYEIRNMVNTDSAYKDLAEYAITVADGNGRLIAFTDHIKGMKRPDPNDKAEYNSIILGDNGVVSQSLLRKQIGNLNFLRMNPGPGSTFKPILFAAIASQLDMDWNAFSSEGFSVQQEYFGGEKVGKYDFEKNNGPIRSVSDYLKYSDNYYHSNVLLLGSYPTSDINNILSTHFKSSRPGPAFHWPYFTYHNRQYFLNGFSNWPGYENGKANFGSDSSSASKGLFSNFEIYNRKGRGSLLSFNGNYDSILFKRSSGNSFIHPEYPLFDQQGTGMDMKKPKETFISSFRGHVKGSSQVMISPVTMVNAFGKLISQNKNYSLTLDPYAREKEFEPFQLGPGITPVNYLALIKGQVFKGLKDVLDGGTASALGTKLKGSKYFYYAKTGTTGDDDLKTKSKLFVIVISQKDISSAGFNFRNNKFYTIYFTSQNGPVKQNEEFQAKIIRLVESSAVFNKYMSGKN